MESLTSVIRKCKLELKLDNPTEGFGNCFPNAIVQQCRRPEIKNWIQKNRPWALFTGHQMLRRKVTNFALRPRDQAVHRLRLKYEQEIGPADKKSWEEYWYQMAKDDCVVHCTGYPHINNIKQTPKSIHYHQGQRH